MLANTFRTWKAPSPRYYADNERRLFTEHFPALDGLKFSRRIYGTRRRTRILAWASREGAHVRHRHLETSGRAGAGGLRLRLGGTALARRSRTCASPVRRRASTRLLDGHHRAFRRTERAVAEIARVLKPGDAQSSACRIDMTRSCGRSSPLCRPSACEDTAEVVAVRSGACSGRGPGGRRQTAIVFMPELAENGGTGMSCVVPALAGDGRAGSSVRLPRSPCLRSQARLLLATVVTRPAVRGAELADRGKVGRERSFQLA